MSHADFLFELGTEELPPKSLTALSNALESSIISQLKVLGLNHTEVISYATPRRLALTINQLASQQADRSESRRGPSVKAPEKAVEGFARSCKVSLQELAVVDTDKGQYYEFERNIKGAKTLDLLADVINKATPFLIAGEIIFSSWIEYSIDSRRKKLEHCFPLFPFFFL